MNQTPVSAALRAACRASLSILFFLALGAVLPAQDDPPPAPAAVEQAEKLMRQGLHEQAIAALRAVIPADAAAEAERSFLGRILAWLGRSDEALQVLEQGLGRGGEDDDASLQWEIGTIHRRLSDDGPFFRREGEMVAYLPHDDSVDEEAFCRDHHRRALDAFAVVLARHPDSASTARIVGGLQERLGMHEAALATWDDLARRVPKSASAWMGKARALAALDRGDEAVLACEQALRASPRLGAAYAMLAEHHARNGDEEQAARARRQAAFYEWAPEFLGLDFDTADASHHLLAPDLGDEPEPEQVEQARAARDAEIERLLATDDATSTALLAAVCYFHGDHGATEDRIYTALESRGEAAVPVLRGLLENAGSTCTQKASARALARLHAPGLLPVLTELLPADVHPIFDGDIAGALAELGDRAAVPALLEVARPGSVDEEPADDPGNGMGHARARARATLALGVLGGEAATAALTAGLDDEVLGPFCRVALLLSTRDEAQLAGVRAVLAAADGLDGSLMRDYLERFAPQLAEALRAAGDGKDGAGGKGK